jgi:hypothetical protein
MLKTKYLILLISLLANGVNAQTCRDYIPDEHPNSRYTINNNGTVTDIQTNLMWKVCAEGQTWENNQCIGDGGYYFQDLIKKAKAIDDEGRAPNQSDSYSFSTYDYAGFNNWRVPNIKELNSIVSQNCFFPAINMAIFPNLPFFAPSFISTTIQRSSYAKPTFIEFYYGNHQPAMSVGQFLSEKGYRLRLVRDAN